MSTITQLVQQSLAASSYQNGGSLPSPVNSGSNAALAAQAAQLSAQANEVVTLTGSQSSDSTLYTAAGLLNTLSAAGSATSSTTASAAESAQQSSNQAIVSSTLGSGSGTSGLLSDTLGTTPATISSDWTSVLKANPALAGEAASALTNGGIVNTLA